MITLLSKLFIKDRDDVSSPRVRSAYGVVCGALGIALNIILFAAKFFAGTLTGSIAITADAFNNLSDAGSSVITLVGFKMSNQKPDTDHPFGHGRIEYLSGLIVSMLILLMGAELLKSSIKKIVAPEPMEFSIVSIIILALSIAVKFYMALYNRRIGKLINSSAMRATATDSFSDTVATSVVLIATILSQFTSFNIDGWCGVAVALFILRAGLMAAKDTISPLLGQPPVAEFVDEIEKTAMETEGVIGVHDLVVHDYGPGRMMISLHAEVSSNTDILSIHDRIDNLERRLKDEYNCHATIHIDPIETDNEITTEMKEKVHEIIRTIDPAIQMHDFRMVRGETHTNLIFDIVIPFKYKYTDNELREMIETQVSKIEGNCMAVIDVDKKYI